MTEGETRAGAKKGAVAASLARAREMALRDVLKVISESRDNEAPVFDAILKSAAQLCNAPLADLDLVSDDGEFLREVATWGEPERGLPSEHWVWRMDSDYANVSAVRQGQVVHVPDIRLSKRYLSGDPVTREAVDVEGMRTILVVPLMAGGRGIGCIILFRSEVLPFTDDEIALVEAFAEQAVIAIENVRQFRAVQMASDELADRLEREQAVSEILEVISQSRDDELPVLEAIVRNAARLCEARIVGLSLTDASRTQLRYACVWGPRHEFFHEGFGFDLDGPLQVARTVREKSVIHTHDLADDPLYIAGDPVRVKMVEEVGARTLLTIPLIKDGVALGCLNLNRNEVKPFSADEITLLESFAAQAVIAIENVRQFREVQTRLERERASAEVLSVISQSRDDEMPVFDVILRNAAQLSGAPLANLCLLNDARSHWNLVAHYGEGLRHLTLGKTTSLLDSKLVPAVSMRTASIVHVEDLVETDLYRQGDPGRVAMVEVEGMRTILGVPLLLEEEAIGCITLFRREVKAFTPDEITLVETFAAQAVIAIENVRQFNEVQERLEREKASGEVLELISRSRDDDLPVFHVILENAVRLCGADRARLMLITEDGAGLRAAGQWGAPNPALPEDAVIEMIPEMLPVRSILEKRTINVKDGRETEGYRKGVPQVVANIDEMQARSVLTVPLIKEDVAIGCIVLTNREIAAYGDSDVSLVETFAAQAVIAIENVRQFREVQERLERERATRDVLEVINLSRSDQAPVFDAILERAATICVVDTASLHLVSSDRTQYRVIARWGRKFRSFELGDAFDLERPNPIPSSIRTGEVVNIADAKDTDLYRAGDPIVTRVVEQENVRSQLIVPLLQQGVAIGGISMSRQTMQPFTDSDISLVETFAEQAVIAIENVRQFKALERLNAELGDRVEEQVGEIERMGKLKSFLPAAVADTVMSKGADQMLSSHRALLGVLFCDIRGFTAFCETAEPEETIEVLQTYHEEMGKLINAHGAGVDHRMGDGIMVLFNDPLPCDDPAADALRLAQAMRVRMVELCAGWKRLGHRLGFGVGISLGYATVGMVGFGGRYDYTASGTAVNLAARLCDLAEDQEILLSQRAATATEDHAELEPAGDVMLKGFHAPVSVFRVAGMRGA